jgi:hypothetical protein
MMKRSSIKRLMSTLFVLAFVWQPLLAQESGKDVTAETSATVPALNDFHTVIFRIWHTAWPKKDYDMLATLLPEVEKGVAVIASTDLPGILRDKKTAWTQEVEKLQAILKEYKAAVEAKQKQPLLDTAEKLHAQYEALVRVIRPPLKELDEFHVVLYKLYHYYMPQESLTQVKASAEQLQEKMTLLNRVILPLRFKTREGSFETARAQLDRSVSELGTAVASSDSGRINAAVETVHSRYEALAQTLE